MTIELKQAASSASNFVEFGAIVKKAKEDISFFGGRYIYAEGYRGSIDIEMLAFYTMKLAQSNYEFTEEERIIGKEIVLIIDKLFENNYSRTLTNLFTKVCCAVRDFFRNLAIFFGGIFCGQVGTRFLWKYCPERDDFEYYTSTQYQKKFGELPESKPVLIRRGLPDRWWHS